MSTLVETEDRGPVRHVILNRAHKRNAINEQLIAALDVALRDAANDPAVLCVVLRGAGPMFSAGMDLTGLSGLSQNPAHMREMRANVLATWNLCEEMPKPTIAQIHGACLGGAMELALACDLRTMARDATIGLIEARVGLLPDIGGCSRLPAVVGLGRAKEMVMTGKLLDGAEAHRVGLANRVAPAEQLDDATDALVAELLECAPISVALAKRILDCAAKPAITSTLEQELLSQHQCILSEDFAEGTRAFAEKRRPQFVGR